MKNRIVLHSQSFMISHFPLSNIVNKKSQNGSKWRAVLRTNGKLVENTRMVSILATHWMSMRYEKDKEKRSSKAPFHPPKRGHLCQIKDAFIGHGCGIYDDKCRTRNVKFIHPPFFTQFLVTNDPYFLLQKIYFTSFGESDFVKKIQQFFIELASKNEVPS